MLVSIQKKVCVSKWRDRREVLMISSEFENEMVEVKIGKNKQKLNHLQFLNIINIYQVLINKTK